MLCLCRGTRIAQFSVPSPAPSLTDYGGTMKQVVLFALLAVSISMWAAPNPDEHPINVHVISSYFVASTGMFEKSVTVQKLSVLIDGKKYELSALATKAGLLVRVRCCPDKDGDCQQNEEHGLLHSSSVIGWGKAGAE